MANTTQQNNKAEEIRAAFENDGRILVFTDNLTKTAQHFERSDKPPQIVPYSKDDRQDFISSFEFICEREEHEINKAVILDMENIAEAVFLQNRLRTKGYFSEVIPGVGTDQAEQLERIVNKIHEKELYKGIPVPNWAKSSKNGYKIDENEFTAVYKADHNSLKAIKGVFHNDYGSISEKEITADIQSYIQYYITNGLSRKAKDLTEAFRNAVFLPVFKPEESWIYCENGVLKLDREGNITHSEVDDGQTVNRFKYAYNPNCEQPERFLTYLDELLYAEDIPTVQQYLGYCLLPNTKAQGYLHIKGDGGEGKSVLIKILEKIFGNSAITDHLDTLEKDRFQLANTENKLLFMDDDLPRTILKDGAKIKTIITGQELLAERKNETKYRINIYCRLFSVGNHEIIIDGDDTNGMYRRLILLKSKPKTRRAADDDPYLADAILADEAEKIFNWLVCGAVETVKRSYHIAISKRAEMNLQMLKDEQSPIIGFVEEHTEIDEKSEFSSAEFFERYVQYCNENAIPIDEKDKRRVSAYLKNNADKLNLSYSTHIAVPDENGELKNTRGFKGRKLL